MTGETESCDSSLYLAELEDKRMRERWAVEDAEQDAKVRAMQAKREQLMRVDEGLSRQVSR